MISSLSVAKMPVAVKITLAIVAVLLLTNICSPLRLNTDAIRYFNITLYLKGLLPPADYAGMDYLPHGYPMLLKCLDALGLLGSKAIIIINILAGLIAGYFICCLLPAKNWLMITALLMLSYINIKHLTLPTADELFAGCLLLGAWFWAKALKRKPVYYIPALLVTAAAIYLRTAGIVIPGGIILYLVYVNRNNICKNKYLLAALAGMLIAVFALFLFKLKGLEQRNDYFRQLDLEGIFHGPNNLLSRVALHLQEMGELLLNVPYSKLNTIAPHSVSFLIMPVIIVAGVFMLALVVYMVRKGRLYRYLIFWIYLCYLLMIVLWPFYDSRFLIPIIPLFIYCLYSAYERYRRFWVIQLLAIIYVVMGLFALTYSTVMSVNREAFLKFYTNDKEIKAGYTQHFNDKQLGKTPVYDINKQRIIYIMNAYDK